MLALSGSGMDISRAIHRPNDPPDGENNFYPLPTDDFTFLSLHHHPFVN